MSLRNRVLESKELEITQNYKKGYHDGIDVVNKNYTLGNIVAHSNGIVVSYRNDCNGFVNEIVDTDTVIGYMGNTCISYVGQLHFEVRNTSDIRIDPTSYLNSDLPNINKTIEELVKEVIEGKWGNGEERKRRLGDKYIEVQTRVNKKLQSKTKYLYNPNYKGNSIVDGLKEISIDSSFNYRKKLAKINNINNYIGSAEQNTTLLNLLKKGKLIDV